MSVTYPHDRPVLDADRPPVSREEPFVPVYARARRGARGGKGGLKTWMILAPVGVLVLGGVAAALMMGDGEDAGTAPLLEPAATGPVFPAAPLPATTASIEVAPLEAVPVEPAATPVAVVRRQPAPGPAPARRAAAPVPEATPAEAGAPTPQVEVASGPQPYTAELNTAPPASAVQAPPPVIIIQPAQ